MVNAMLIAAICSSVFTSPGEVCPKTTEALGRQFGVYQTLEATENYLNSEAAAATPEVIKIILVYGATANQFARGGDLRFYFKVPKVCDNVGVGGSFSSQSVDMRWIF